MLLLLLLLLLSLLLLLLLPSLPLRLQPPLLFLLLLQLQSLLFLLLPLSQVPPCEMTDPTAPAPSTWEFPRDIHADWPSN